jgi:hypothetical protein
MGTSLSFYGHIPQFLWAQASVSMGTSLSFYGHRPQFLWPQASVSMGTGLSFYGHIPQFLWAHPSVSMATGLSFYGHRPQFLWAHPSVSMATCLLLFEIDILRALRAADSPCFRDVTKHISAEINRLTVLTAPPYGVISKEGKAGPVLN